MNLCLANAVDMFALGFIRLVAAPVGEDGETRRKLIVVLGCNSHLLTTRESFSNTIRGLSVKAMTVKPKSRVELHLHMDGAPRASTIWELSKSKGLPLPGDGSLEALEEALVVTKPSTLCNFLKGFEWICPVFMDDLKAAERLAYEVCEDKANDGVLYAELRYSPHEMVSGRSSIVARDVVMSSLAGMQRAEHDFDIKTRLILCCMRCFPDQANEVVQLCDEFRDKGVVGIDVAGDECADVDKRTGIEKFDPKIVNAVQEAARRGIHRTVHAGEAGPANGVETAVDVLKAERIGHGYHVFEDDDIYKKIVASGVHFETCPYSSILTGAVPIDGSKHPIVRFAEAGVNFSIGTDDPTITASTLSSEYQLLYKWGLTEAHIIKTNLNAIRASFLPEDEKQDLLKQLKANIGIFDH